MDKIKIGLPRALHYYYDGELWKSFFEELGCEVIVSPPTTAMILEEGMKIANDEMCLSLKVYLGHVSYLVGKCDYVFIPRIDNYGMKEQTCTNFLSVYDIVHNLLTENVLDCNIEATSGLSEMKAFIEVGKKLGKGKEQALLAYYNGVVKKKKFQKKKQLEIEKSIDKGFIRLLWLAHPYNTYDALIGKEVYSFLEKMGVSIIDGYYLERKSNEDLSKKLSPTLYWKYNKELIGSILEVEKQVDGVIFLSSFPCGPDSLVNELMLRKIKIPYLNIIMDDVHSLTGIETRLESFIDILERRKQEI